MGGVKQKEKRSSTKQLKKESSDSRMWCTRTPHLSSIHHLSGYQVLLQKGSKNIESELIYLNLQGSLFQLTVKYNTIGWCAGKLLSNLEDDFLFKDLLLKKNMMLKNLTCLS